MPKFKVSVVDDAKRKELKKAELEAADGQAAAEAVADRPLQKREATGVRATSIRTDMPAGEVRHFYEKRKRRGEHTDR